MSFGAFIALVSVSIHIRPGGDSRNGTIGDAGDRYCWLRELLLAKTLSYLFHLFRDLSLLITILSFHSMHECRILHYLLSIRLASERPYRVLSNLFILKPEVHRPRPRPILLHLQHPRPHPAPPLSYYYN